MWNTSSKLMDQIFELKFTSKQLVKESKKAESEEKAQKVKAKQAIEKNNIEGAKIYAQNAIRKKSEALNYLQLASRLDAVVSRLDSQAKQQVISKSMVGIVKSLGQALKSTPLDKMMVTMNSFEKQFENLDVQTGVMEDAMNSQAALSTPADEVETLLQKIADENNLELKIKMPVAGTAVAAPPAAAAAPAETEFEAALRALRGA